MAVLVPPVRPRRVGVAPRGRSGPASAPVRWAPWTLAAVLFAGYSGFALLRAARLETAGYDLGIFTQAVRQYAHFHAPMVAIKGAGFNLLGDHFSPVLAVLAPLYRIWPSSLLLVVAQAALIAVSVVPVTRLAMRRLRPAAGVLVGLAYGLSWGLQGAIAFDFHEVAFAVPLLAFGLVALAEQRWWAAFWWTVALVTVKEDLGLTVAAVGGYLLVRRQWRPGVGAVVIGAGAFLLTTLVLIPHLDHLFHTYRYWGVVTRAAPNTASVPGPGDVARLLAALPHQLTVPGKARLLLWVFGITGFLALRSPLVVLTLPTVLWRLVASGPQYWSTGPVHYNVVLMPMVFVALVDGLSRMTSRSGAVAAESPGGSPLRRAAGRAVGPGNRLAIRVGPPAVLAIGLLLLPRLAFWDLTKAATYRPDQRAAAARELAVRIPSGARVAASNYLIPLVVDRCDVVLFPPVRQPPVAYLLVDATNLYGVGLPHDQQEAALAAAPSHGFQRVAERDGVVLFASRG